MAALTSRVDVTLDKQHDASLDQYKFIFWYLYLQKNRSLEAVKNEVELTYSLPVRE
jgi:hypothetical protein